MLSRMVGEKRIPARQVSAGWDAPGVSRSREALLWLDQRANVVGLAVAIAVLIVLFSIKSPHFLTVFELQGDRHGNLDHWDHGRPLDGRSD
jgi:hypothetical protein